MVRGLSLLPNAQGTSPRMSGPTLPDAPRTHFGYRVKVLWIMAPSQDKPVSVTAANIHTGAPVFFDVEDVAQHDVAVSLDPRRGSGEGAWKEFPSYMYFDSASCFEITASWTDGSWRLVFGLGR